MLILNLLGRFHLKNKTTFVISCAVLALDLKRAAKDMGICNADTVFFRRSTPEELSEASDSSQFLISFLRYGRDVGWRTVFTCISIVSDGDSPIFSNSAIHAPIPSEFSALPIRFARQSFRVLFVTIRKRVFLEQLRHLPMPGARWIAYSTNL
jgi:hypothetical protein